MDELLYLAVVQRAAGYCEAFLTWDDRHEHEGRAEIDHWLGGVGRRRKEESAASVWLLCVSCHEQRTANRPHAGHWNDLFRAHCERRGLPFIAHKDLRDILGEAAIGTESRCRNSR